MLVLIIFAAFALRVSCLYCQSLWLDEAASAYRTTLPLPALFQDAARNLQAPGYFLLLRAWVALAGMSAFSLRYFSVLTGILLAPVAYWFAGRYLHHRRAALLSAALVALNPAHIYYSQETRMYAVLPVLYLLILGLARQLWRRPRPVHWIALAILEVFAAYLHLFSTFMLVAANLLLAWAYVRRRPTRQFLGPWLSSQLLVFVAILPWLWFTWRNGGSLPANLDATAAGAASFSVQNYLGQLWPFLWTGLTGLRPVFTYWSLLLAAVLVLGLALTYRRTPSSTRRALAALILSVVVPLLLGTLVWTYNPLTHPRYLLFLAGPLTILLAQGLTMLARRRIMLPVAAAALLLLILLDVSAVRAVRLDPEHRRYDAAALASAIARRASPEDVVLMPPNDRSLWYYDPAPASVANWPFAGGDQEARTEHLTRLIESHESAFLVEYHDLYSYDPHEQVRHLLEANGHLLEQFTVDRMDVYHIALGDSSRSQVTPLDISCGPLRLTGAAFPNEVQPGDAPTLALHWRLEEDTAETYVVSARLMDGANQLAGADKRLLSEEETETARWQVGTEATTYYLLPFPLGTPPLSYSLDVMLYPEGGQPLHCGENEDYALIHMGSVSLSRADQRADDAYGTWEAVDWRAPAEAASAEGIEVEAYSIRPHSVRPGEPIFITLRWRAKSEVGRELHPVLLLSRLSDETLFDRTVSKLFQRHPTTHWREGDLYIETLQLNMYATLEPLQLAIAERDTLLQTLGDIRIDPTVLQWNLPSEASRACVRFQDVGALRGYQWQVTDEGTAATLTLYWQGNEESPTDTSYTVFAQLQAPDGWVLAQDDSLPADGDRPTTTWLPGEIISDEHHIPLPGDRPDQTRLAIGFYDLATLERVPAYGCDGNRLPDDAVIIHP